MTDKTSRYASDVDVVAPVHVTGSRLLRLMSGGLALLAATGTVGATDTSGAMTRALGNDTGYWTADRLRNARPRDLPAATSVPAPPEAAQPAVARPSVAGAGRPPKLRIKPDFTNKLFEPRSSADVSSQDEVVPQNVGTRGAQFSSTRVFPDRATTTYPYRAVGKLFFSEAGRGDFICSASVLRPRVVATAGHCVHSGNRSASGYFTNFLFVPAYRSGVAPYGRWTPVSVTTTTAWINGGGSVPNAADYAMFDMADLNGRKIGDVTGYLGYVTNNLLPNHAHLLGYPGNLDNGQRMHQVTAESFAADANNSVVYGSDMRGGSSGGPWVQNFGVAAAGQSGGANALRNAIIGITSYGPVEVGPLYQGSSIPDSRFLNLLNRVCGRRAGNC